MSVPVGATERHYGQVIPVETVARQTAPPAHWSGKIQELVTFVISSQSPITTSFLYWLARINTVTFLKRLPLTDTAHGEPRDPQVPVLVPACRGDVCGCLLRGHQGPDHFFSLRQKRSSSPQTDQVQAEHLTVRTAHPGWPQC